jgi:hypothetical protein
VRDDLRTEWTWLGVVGVRVVPNDGESICCWLLLKRFSVCLKLVGFGAAARHARVLVGLVNYFSIMKFDVASSMSS